MFLRIANIALLFIAVSISAGCEPEQGSAQPQPGYRDRKEAGDHQFLHSFRSLWDKSNSPLVVEALTSH